jgi:hypothetical protein
MYLSIRECVTYVFGRAVAGVLWGGCTQLFSMYPCYLSIRFSLYGFHMEGVRGCLSLSAFWSIG